MIVTEPKTTGGGRLASRLIQDWYAGRLVQDEQGLPAASLPEDRKSELPTQCPSLREFPPRPDAGSDHDFVIIPSQSYDEAHDPEGRGRSLVRCMCRYCRFHFRFHIYPPVHEESTAHLQHHLRLEEAEWHNSAEPSSVQLPEQHSRWAQFRYACTVCGMTVHLEMFPPLLKPEWIKLMMDEEKIREALRIARQQDPERYADISPEKETHYMTSAPSTLNLYIKNILEEDVMGPRKKISFRNKTFQVQFGPDCESMFRSLGFQVQDDKATQDSYWVPPRLPPQEGKTPVGSLRAFYEDVRSEVQSLLDDKPAVNGQPAAKVLPIPAREQLEKALACDKAPRSTSTMHVNGEEAPHFAILGAPVGADDALLKYAYIRQVETNPDHAPAYLGALGHLSERRAEDLQMFVIAEQESIATTKKEASAVSPDASSAEKAYAHFGLRRDCPEEPAYFLRVYMTYREESPAQKSDHRLALLEIAKDRNSDVLAAEVYGTEMELAEACQLLKVQSDWPMDSIAQMAHSVASDMDIELVLMALETISRNRSEDDPNRPAFEQVLTVLRASRQLQDLSASPDRAGDETAAPDQSGAAVDMELPVGLANLRNTCYLNSILQYFYSVNAVREVTLNADLPVLEPTEENLSNILRRSGSSSSSNSQSQSELETGRTFVGYEFTRELSILFREIEAAGESSISPRQRLANAALLRPEMLRPRSAHSKAVPGANDGDAPPLPPRTTENAKPKISEAPMTEAELCETASSTSSRTLVDQPEADNVPKSVEEDAPAIADVPSGDQHAEEQPKMSKLTVEELAVELDKPNVGSDQMDVDEVMGNTIDHLRAAFKVSGVGGSESAPDPIEQAFFSTFIDNRKKIGEPDWSQTSRSDRWVTAYPAQSGTLDLYDALANSFDLETLPGSRLSFTTIKRPAPHFHVCIQRSDGRSKNVNPITIPETLYLDRFMHTDDKLSPLAKGRKRKWDIKTRLTEMTSMAPEHLETAKPESRVTSGPSELNTQHDLPEEEVDAFMALNGLNTSVEGSSFPATDMDLGTKQLFAKYGVAEPRIANPGGQPPPRRHDEGTIPPSSDIEGSWEKFVAEEKAERARLIAERNSLFSNSHAIAYRLHAVVCHAGSTASAGHYWVWIHDFERDVWRKYNDTRVSVHPAEYVFGELNTKGEPYYLAYVKADEVQKLVSVPQRRPQSNPPPVPPRVGPASAQDTVMGDADRVETKPIIEHVEDVEMHPLPTAAA